MDYAGLRIFADNWGLSCLFLLFIGIVAYVFRPGARKRHDAAARTPRSRGLNRIDYPHRSEPERDEITGTATTGHQWDGIKQLNTPLPRWRPWTFYVTVIWTFSFMVLYAAVPLIAKASGGILGYSSRGAVDAELAAAKAEQAGSLERVDQASLGEIRADQELFQYAVAGAPNLNDDEWLRGGTPDDSYATIAHGIRYEAIDETRSSRMSAFGRDGILRRDEIERVADYLLSMSGQAEAGSEGEQIYLDNCAACYGEDGGGDRLQGAPALNDAIWVHDGEHETVIETITNARFGIMPAWSHRLEDATLKKLAIYVHALGGGE